MPDPTIATLERGDSDVPRDKAPISEDSGYHKFVESEFPNGAGRCDRCGGGPDAEIHQKPVDQMERIADALEDIALSLTTLLELAHDCTRPCQNGRAVNTTVEE